MTNSIYVDTEPVNITPSMVGPSIITLIKPSAIKLAT